MLLARIQDIRRCFFTSDDTNSAEARFLRKERRGKRPDGSYNGVAVQLEFAHAMDIGVDMKTALLRARRGRDAIRCVGLSVYPAHVRIWTFSELSFCVCIATCCFPPCGVVLW